MARENQGLQIALIVFALLTIIFGVTTYMGYSKAKGLEKELETSRGETNAERGEKQKLSDDLGYLKKIAGFSEEDSRATIEGAFTEKMQKFRDLSARPVADEVVADTATGTESPAPTLPSYRDALAVVESTVARLENALARSDSEIKELKTQLQNQRDSYEKQLAEKKRQLADAEQKEQSTTTELSAARDKVVADRLRESEAAAARLRKANEEKAALEEKIKEANRAGQKLIEQVITLRDRFRREKGNPLERPTGRIEAVDQASRIVWINLGTADALPLQATFAVYPAGSSNVAGAAKKGSIEVTEVKEPHRALCRITEDQPTDPILEGDRFYSPVWRPGEKVHVAMAGLIDLDEDGRSDAEQLRHILEMQNIVVDAYIDRRGNRVGKIAETTDYLIQGSGESAELAAATTAMLTEAERSGVEKMSLKELLRKAGITNPKNLIQYGPGGSHASSPTPPASKPQAPRAPNPAMYQRY